jgi:ankyrin repeat protein
MSIHSACAFGNVQMVTNFLKTNSNLINSKDMKQNNLLQTASINGQIYIAEILLDFITDDEQRQQFIEYINSDGNDAIILAIKYSRIKMVTLLIHYGALNDPNKKQHALQTALHTKNYVIITELIKNDCINDHLLLWLVEQINEINKIIKSIDCQILKLSNESSSNKRTIKMITVRNKYNNKTNEKNHCRHNIDLCNNMIKLLLTKNIDISQKNDNHTALYQAAYYGYTKIVKMLIDQNGLELESNPYKILCICLYNKHIDVADLIVNEIINNHQTVLQNLAQKNNPNLIILCLNDHYVNIAIKLLDNGVYFKGQDYDKNNALMIAIKNGYDNIANKLIDSGISLNHINNNNDNALMIAIKNGNDNIANKLIDSGISLNHVNNNDNALMIAIANKHMYIANKLIDSGISLGQNVMYEAILQKYFDIVVAMIKKDPTLANTEYNGLYIVFTLVRYNQLPCLKIILENFTQENLNNVVQLTSQGMNIIGWICNNYLHNYNYLKRELFIHKIKEIKEIIDLLPNKETLLFQDINGNSAYKMATYYYSNYDFIELFGIKTPNSYYQEHNYDKVFEIFNITKKIINKNGTLNELCSLCWTNEINVQTNCKHGYCIDCYTNYHCIKSSPKCAHCRTLVGKQINIII